MNTSSHRIYDALQAVALLRAQQASDCELTNAVIHVKRFQTRRFRATYEDLLQNPRYQTATTFFLQELYGERDYSQRDQQFGRIANSMEKLFPQSVVNTAAALAEAHCLTEQLDDLMAREWRTSVTADPQPGEVARYIHCWRHATDETVRHHQVEVVLVLGRELDRLTRKPGLRTLLRMMRGPAMLAGLESLQHFLEVGFDSFAGMRSADVFLRTIEEREAIWIASLSNDPLVACETKTKNLLMRAGVT